MECVRHVNDEPLQGAVNPKEVLAVFHRVFQAEQNNPFGGSHRGVDLGPQRVPDEHVFRTSILFELGEEGKLGQHTVIHAKVTLEFVHVVEEQALPLIRLGLRPACETRVCDARFLGCSSL